MLASTTKHPGSMARRGVTLVEMLVTVAVLVIMMTILVQIFQAATGSVSAAQAYQALDDQLRRLDGIIRSDLEGVTARFTPPLNPALNLGYFEYGENEFADLQGEDSDDYVRFTAKAPPGRPFTGRFWPNPWPANNPTFAYNVNVNAPYFPITITSDYAEIIYFVRNGNLYRRVLLIAPELQSSIVSGAGHLSVTLPQSILGTVSWQGVNDLSARPSATGSTANGTATNSIILNSLGDLTNRENRFAYSRFGSDFYNAATASAGQDGIPDDINGDNIPDLYPSLYPTVFNTGLILSPNYPASAATALLAFPFMFPGAYSQPQNLAGGYQYGWIHSPTPAYGNPAVTFDQNPTGYVHSLNHNPIDVGDNLPVPALTSEWQTWWGFPTWRETLSANWADPALQVNLTASQPPGLVPLNANQISGGHAETGGNPNLLPPMVTTWGTAGNQVYMPTLRNMDQLFCDQSGTGSQFLNGPWAVSWEDDLILAGVRSFDVKAYDNSLSAYADLGWGDDPTVTGVATAPYLAQTPFPAVIPVNNQYFDLLNQSFAHEGRMPPLVNDHRLDYSYPNPNYPNLSPLATTTLAANIPNAQNYYGNVGDNTNGIVRLRRIWDSWSTEYSQAPATGIGPLAAGNFPIGPPFSPPIYPSYPPPYPAPLRGIQIQIRVVDPTNQRIKSLTIREDFTDKL